MSDDPSTSAIEQDASGGDLAPSVATALLAGIVAAGFALAMFTVGTGGSWWFVVAGCAAATLVGLSAGARRDRRAKLVESWATALALVAIYLTAAIAAIVAGSRRHLLWEVLAGAIVGAAIGSGGLLVLQDLLTKLVGGGAGQTGPQADRRQDYLRASIQAGLATSVALVLLIWGMSSGGQLMAAEGILVFTVAVIYLFAVIGDASRRSPVWSLLVGAALMVQAIVFLLSGEGLDLSTGLGIGCWLLGLTLLKLGYGPELEKLNQVDGDRVDYSDSRRLCWLILAATVAGGVALWWGATRSNQLAVLASLSVVVIGLSFLGLSVTRVGLGQVEGSRHGLIVSGAAVVFLLVGFGLAQRAILVWPLALLASFLVAAVGAWFVLRGEALVAIMLIGFVIIWGLADRSTDASLDPNPTAPARILALGDSFISGEGAPDYFEGTNNVGADRNECRRAPTAYPYLVAEVLDMGLDFYACSGAKTSEIMSVAQMPESPEEIPGAKAQLAYVTELTEPQKEAIEVVLVSIGGNDVGFSTIIQACLLPRDCNELEQTWNANVDRLAPALTDTYQAIGEALPGATIVVVPYPHIVAAEGSCGLGIRSAEHEFVVDFIDRLNGQIDLAAAEAGVSVFAANRTSLADHLLCDDEPGINHLHLSATGGDWLGRYSPDKWIHASMHPNTLGHRLIADRLAPFLCAGVLDQDVVTACAAQPDPVVAGTGDDRDVDALAADLPSLADQAQEQLEDGKWVRDQLYATLASILAPTGLLLLGGMLGAAGMVIGNRAPQALDPREERRRNTPDAEQAAGPADGTTP